MTRPTTKQPSKFELIYSYDPDQPTDRPHPSDASEACRFLEEGNRLFASLGTGSGPGMDRHIVAIDHADLGIDESGAAPTQLPYAIVLGCSDARAPIELLFHRACNELFVVRVAGNILGQEQLGSIDYAAMMFSDSVKAIVVLGHSGCGAVGAAVQAFLSPKGYFDLASNHRIRAIVDALFPAVRTAAAVLAKEYPAELLRGPSYADALIEFAVTMNAAMNAAILREEFGRAGRDLRIVWGVYDLASRLVHVPLSPEANPAEEPCFVEAPANSEDFERLAGLVARSSAIRRRLGACA